MTHKQALKLALRDMKRVTKTGWFWGWWAITTLVIYYSYLEYTR